MNYEEMLKIANKKRAERAATLHEGYGDNNHGRDRNKADYTGSHDARARMLARMSTNAERIKEEATQRRADQEKQKAETARLARLTPYERDIQRAKIREAERLERWAKTHGWKNYQEYLDDQAAKRNGRY